MHRIHKPRISQYLGNQYLRKIHISAKINVPHRSKKIYNHVWVTLIEIPMDSLSYSHSFRLTEARAFRFGFGCESVKGTFPPFHLSTFPTFHLSIGTHMYNAVWKFRFLCESHVHIFQRIYLFPEGGTLFLYGNSTCTVYRVPLTSWGR